MKTIIVALAAVTLLSAPVMAADPVPFDAPKDIEIPALPNAEQVLLGKRLMNETKRLLPDHVGAEMNCTSCHLAGGKTPLGSPLVGTSRFYPAYNPRAGREVDLKDRINGCFMRSMNGKPLPRDGKPMEAMVAYIDWLSSRLPPQIEKMQGDGIGAAKISKNLVPNPVNGEKIYGQACAMCHGNDGEGMKDAQDEYVFPPLWGDKSFNIGAGMARPWTAAAFVLHNMPLAAGGHGPLGQGRKLTPQEALDVGYYFAFKPRPDFPAKVNDWLKDRKPHDARY